jgi:hypothetical protein
MTVLDALGAVKTAEGRRAWARSMPAPASALALAAAIGVADAPPVRWLAG